MREEGLERGCSPESVGVLNLYLGSLGRSWGKSSRKRRAKGLCGILQGPGLDCIPSQKLALASLNPCLASFIPHCLC